MVSRKRAANVFEDVGFPPAEAEHLLIRANLMIEVRRVVESRNLTQAAAAKMFAVTQPRVSDLMRGKIDRFSIDTLIVMLQKAGVGVTVKVMHAVLDHQMQAHPERITPFTSADLAGLDTLLEGVVVDKDADLGDDFVMPASSRS